MWTQVTAAACRIGSTALGLALRLRRGLAGTADGGSNPPCAPSPTQISYIHESIGEPHPQFGDVGHWYVDPLAMRLYGPKGENGWPADYVRLLGPARDRLNRLERTMAGHYAVEKIRGPIDDWFLPMEGK